MSVANFYGQSPQLPVISTPTTFVRVDYNGTGTQAITNATATAVQFPNAVLSKNFPAPTSTSTTYAAPFAGWYSISYTISYNSFTGIGVMDAWILKASASVRYANVSIPSFEASALTAGPPVSAITLGTDNVAMCGSCIIYLDLAETFQVQTYQNSGSSQNLLAGADTSLISINFLHE
jgi:hypothetical protein